MRHAGPDALAALAPLLERLRAMPTLKEQRSGVFYRKGRATLHFHEDPSGLHADLRLVGDDFERMRVETPAEQDALIQRILSALGNQG